MKNLLKKLALGAVSVMAVFGLTGCSTEGLSKDQVETMMNTVEQTQTFMGDVSTIMGDQLDEYGKYIKELKNQNTLKQYEVDELTRQNDLKEQELNTISKEDAYNRFKTAYYNFLMNKDAVLNNVKLDIESYYNNNEIYTGTGKLVFHEIEYDNGKTKTYLIMEENYIFDDETGTQYVVGYSSGDKFYDVSLLGNYNYESVIDVNFLISSDIIEKLASINELSKIYNIKRLDDGSVELMIMFDGDEELPIYITEVIIDSNDRIASLLICGFDLENKLIEKQMLSFDYNYSITDAEFMQEYNQVLGDYEIKLPILFKAMKDVKRANELVISFEGEEETWSSVEECIDANPGSEEIFELYQDVRNINIVRINEHTVEYTYDYEGTNQFGETIRCDVVYTVSDGKLAKITLVYDEDNKPTLNIEYPAENND